MAVSFVLLLQHTHNHSTSTNTAYYNVRIAAKLNVFEQFQVTTAKLIQIIDYFQNAESYFAEAHLYEHVILNKNCSFMF